MAYPTQHDGTGADVERKQQRRAETSLPPLTDEEAEDFKEWLRIGRASIYASENFTVTGSYEKDEAAAIAFAGGKKW